MITTFPATTSQKQAVLRNLVPFLLVVAGVSYPVVRTLLPGPNRIALLLPLGLLVLWFVWRTFQAETRFATLHSPLGIPLLLLAISFTISSLLGVAPPVEIVNGMFDWITVAVLLFLAADRLAAGWSPRLFVVATLITTSLVLLAGVLTMGSWLLSWLLVWQPGDTLLPVGFRREMGNYAPNPVAMLINYGLPFAIVACWRATRWMTTGGWLLWLLAATVVLFYTGSRGGWLGMVVVAGTVVLPLLWSSWRARRWRRFWTTIGLATGYAVLFVTLFAANLYQIATQRIEQDRVLATEPSTEQLVAGLTTSTGRDVMWSYALDYFTSAPLVGIGPSGYTTRYAADETHSRVFLPVDPHSIYMGVLAEGGLLGVISLVVLAVAVVRVWWRGWQQTPTRLIDTPSGTSEELFAPGRLLLLGCAGMVIGFATHGAVEVPPTGVNGIVFYTLAAGLVTGGAWRWTESTGSTILQVPRLPVNLMHLGLVILAVVAWGTSILVFLQRSQREGLEAAAQQELHRSDYAAALEQYEQIIRRYPDASLAHTGRATALAWLAYNAPDDLTTLEATLAAQEVAMQQHPANQIAPVNRGALLLAAGEQATAEAVLLEFAATDRVNWAAPWLLLAVDAEAQGDLSQARVYWEEALERQPSLAESAACLQSSLCSTVPLEPSAYQALVEVRELVAQSDVLDTATLDYIWALGSRWQSIDIWALGAAAAANADDNHRETRFRAAAADQASAFTMQPTLQLALLQLDTALAADDLATVRALVETWVARPDVQMMPQVSQLLVTTTERELADRLVVAAEWLDDPELLAAAEAYQQRLELAFEAIPATPTAVQP